MNLDYSIVFSLAPCLEEDSFLYLVIHALHRFAQNIENFITTFVISLQDFNISDVYLSLSNTLAVLFSLNLNFILLDLFIMMQVPQTVNQYSPQSLFTSTFSNTLWVPNKRVYLNPKIIGGTVLFSTKSGNSSPDIALKEELLNMNDEEFNEWFRGLADAEGSFGIKDKNQGKNFEFRFRITMHIDEKPLLLFLQERLVIGKIYC